MQCHNYISDVYNKPNRLKIGWKFSKLLFKKYMYHYQHNVMVSELTVARWPPCADVRLRWPATRTRHLVFIYIYGYTSHHEWLCVLCVYIFCILLFSWCSASTLVSSLNQLISQGLTVIVFQSIFILLFYTVLFYLYNIPLSTFFLVFIQMFAFYFFFSYTNIFFCLNLF